MLLELSVMLVPLLLWVYRYFYRPKTQVLLHQPSSTGSFWIYERGKYRYFSFKLKGSCVQGILDLTHPERVVFKYQRLCLLGLLLVKDPQDVLIIGFGTGSFTGTLGHLLPQASIVALEVLPELLSCAQHYFHFQPSANTTVQFEDGASYLASNSKKFDLIFLDAFNEDGFVLAFLEDKVIVSLQEALTTQGVLFVNTFFDDQDLLLEYRAYKKAFNYVKLLHYPTGKDGNKVLVASKQPFPGLRDLEKWRQPFSHIGVDIDVLAMSWHQDEA